MKEIKNYIKWSLNFTTTKLLSYLIFFGATAVSVVVKDGNVFIQGMMYAALLQGVKTVAEGIKNKNV